MPDHVSVHHQRLNPPWVPWRLRRARDQLGVALAMMIQDVGDGRRAAVLQWRTGGEHARGRDRRARLSRSWLPRTLRPRADPTGRSRPGSQAAGGRHGQEGARRRPGRGKGRHAGGAGGGEGGMEVARAGARGGLEVARAGDRHGAAQCHGAAPCQRALEAGPGGASAGRHGRPNHPRRRWPGLRAGFGPQSGDGLAQAVDQPAQGSRSLHQRTTP
jgi:hypothetical protein